jgi:hypothetical protein
MGGGKEFAQSLWNFRIRQCQGAHGGLVLHFGELTHDRYPKLRARFQLTVADEFSDQIKEKFDAESDDLDVTALKNHSFAVLGFLQNSDPPPPTSLSEVANNFWVKYDTSAPIKEEFLKVLK